LEVPFLSILAFQYLPVQRVTGWSDHPIIPYRSHDRLCHDCLQEPLDESLGALPADETPEADPSDSDGLGWTLGIGTKTPRNSMFFDC